MLRSATISLRQRNISIVIISGAPRCAKPTQKLAEELGIDNYFAETLPENTAHSKPWGKASLIANLQEEGRKSVFPQGLLCAVLAMASMTG